MHVLETGTVNELKIENTGSEDVFIQAGDIVKGGRQDRVLSMSFVLPPKSGEVPICGLLRRARPLERARGRKRHGLCQRRRGDAVDEGQARNGRAALRQPRNRSWAGDPAAERTTSRSTRQSRVWDSVAETQSQLTASLNAPVAADASASSLQLSLENEKLKETQAAYVKALQDAGEGRTTSSATLSRSTVASRAPTSIRPTACSAKCGRSSWRRRHRGDRREGRASCRAGSEPAGGQGVSRRRRSRPRREGGGRRARLPAVRCAMPRRRSSSRRGAATARGCFAATSPNRPLRVSQRDIEERRPPRAALSAF